MRRRWEVGSDIVVDIGSLGLAVYRIEMPFELRNPSERFFGGFGIVD